MTINLNCKSVLVVVAHPDDEVLGCGGLISKYSSKIDFNVLFIAEGSSCRFHDPKCESAKNAQKIRAINAKKALTHLGVRSSIFADFPCGCLDQVPLIEINRTIEQAIRKHNPQVIITHSDCDSNQDHIKVLNSAIIASRPGSSSVKMLLSCEVPSSTEWGFKKQFKPNICFELSSIDLENKNQALSFYESEIKKFPFPRSRDGLESLAKMRGMQFGFEYGEAFQLIRGSLE